MSLKLFSNYYQCPTCWIEFKDTNSKYLPQYFDPPYEKKCEFCEKNPSELQVLVRQIQFLPEMVTANIPYFLQNLIKHIDLKE